MRAASLGMAGAAVLAVLLPAGASGSAGPDASVLVVKTEDIPQPNADLLQDSGQTLGWGDRGAGNGVPDGWRVFVTSGGMRFAAGPARGEQTTTRVTLDEDTVGSLFGRTAPAVVGETFVLRTAIDPGADLSHPAAIGIAFSGAQGLFSYALHRVETEAPGWQDVEIRATAPEGTTGVFVRWLLTGAPKQPGGTFDVAPVRVERMAAESRAKAFPLRHVFLVTIETLRADHTSLYGYPRKTTPNLERMAAEGARFERHYTQAPYTRPSLSSLVTSRYPVSLGIVENLPSLPASAHTVSEMFAGGGYVTGGFLAQFLLSQHYGFNQGFHYFFNHPNDTPAASVYADFLPWLDAHEVDNTFTWMHLFDPHGPYRPVDAWKDRFQDDALYRDDTRVLTAGTNRATGAFIPGYVADAGKLERRWYVSNYDSEIAYTDAKLGELMAWIEASGHAKDSLVVVTADHGESMTDHGRFFAHGSLYDHDLHVPMVVWAPGRVPAGRVVTERSAHLDIVPTLLDYAGLKAPTNLKGRSLRALVEGGKAPQPFTAAVVGDGEKEQVAVVGDGPLKIIVGAKGRALEAYALAADPTELTNVVEARRAEADAMAAAYTKWMAAQLVDDAPKKKPVTTKKKQPEGEELEMLRALGYVD